MSWLRIELTEIELTEIELTEEEQRIVLVERESHPNGCVRRRLWATPAAALGFETRTDSADSRGRLLDGAARRPGVSHGWAGSPAVLRA